MIKYRNILKVLSMTGFTIWGCILGHPAWAASDTTKKKDPLQVSTEPMIIPILCDQDVKGYLTLRIVLKTASTEQTKIIRKSLNRLHSAIFMDLYGVLYALSQTNLDSLSVEAVKNCLFQVCKNTLGSEAIQDIQIPMLKPVRNPKRP